MEKIAEIVAALDAVLSTTGLANFYGDRKRRKGGHHWIGPLFLVQKGASGKREGYAYHKGGREELQFNVGFEDEGDFFRYGVAFSLEAGRGLLDPIEVLRPKISRFNEVIASFPDLNSLALWQHKGTQRRVLPAGPIPDDWVQRGAFIFFGARVEVPKGGVDSVIVDRAAGVLASLQPLYACVEYGDAPLHTPVDFKVARLCWNLDYWQRPTGRRGKSRNKDTFEYQHGYGHEEWLFDRGMLLDGWKYGFIQALNHSHRSFEGKSLSVLLYSMDADSRRRFWVGSIGALEVLTNQQAHDAAVEFRELGWLKAMQSQLETLGLASSSLVEASPIELVNLRFRPEALRIFDPPVPFPPAAVPSTYYGTMQRVPSTQIDVLDKGKQSDLFERNLRATKATRYSYEAEREIDLVQTQWQHRLRHTLPEDLPGAEILIEAVVEDRRIDAVIVNGRCKIFVELKARGTVRQVIRDALAQLLEYAFWPNAQRCQVLLIVGADEAGASEQSYLEMLRKRFNVPVYYLQYRDGRIMGIADWLCALAG